MSKLSTIILFIVLLVPGLCAADGLRSFEKKNQPTTARHSYLMGRFKVSERVARAVQKIPLAHRLVRNRKVLQVTNKTLDSFSKATAKGYLEVVVPANKGHVYFRHGGQVFDFYPKGLRVGPVRPIGSERYGFLVPLTSRQELKLKSYLKHMKKTRGRELGKYDFHGDTGFHCVSWMMRLALGDKKGDSLVKVLGGRHKDGASMPRFASFMLKKAKNVEAVVVYNDTPSSRSQLTRLGLQLMSSKELRRAHAEMAD